GAHGILGDDSLQLAQTQVIGAVQHTAVSVAAAVTQVVAVLFGSSHIHHRAVELLGNQGLGGLGTKVAQENHQCITFSSPGLSNGFQHILFVFNSLLDLDNFAARCAIGLDDIGTASLGQGNHKAITANGNNTQLDLRDIVHGNGLL